MTETASDIIHEQEQGRLLHQAALDHFTAKGVNGLSLAKNTWGDHDFVRIDDVVWLPNGAFEFGRYSKSKKTESACTFIVRDIHTDPLDVIAWQATTGRLASWLGQAALIGEDQLFAPRLTDGLPVFETPMQWFQEKRTGVVVLNKARAVQKLRDAAPLIACNIEHGEKLKEMLRVAPPRILIPANASQQEAA